MRLFPVPMDLTGEEKTVGGVISIRQVAYALGGCVIAVLAYFFFRILGLPVFAAGFAAAVLFAAFVYLAFGTPYGYPADYYILLWFRWRLRRRRFWWGDDLS